MTELDKRAEENGLNRSKMVGEAVSLLFNMQRKQEEKKVFGRHNRLFCEDGKQLRFLMEMGYKAMAKMSLEIAEAFMVAEEEVTEEDRLASGV